MENYPNSPSIKIANIGVYQVKVNNTELNMELSSQEFTVQGLTSLVNPTPSSFFQINTGTIYSLYSLKGRFLLKTKFKTLHF